MTQAAPAATAADLARLMGQEWTHSPEQFAAISAPLAPAVVIAGAGSGKTAVMAARVVWLVANSHVRPEEILGLTFTTKATAELADRVRTALTAAGLLGPEADEPRISTYHAYAGDLLREHGLRIGHEPDSRLIADASRFQLAARAIARHTGSIEHLSDHPRTVITNLLALDAEMAEHLVDIDDVLAEDDATLHRIDRAAAGSRAAGHFAKLRDVIARRRELLGLVGDYRALKHDLGLVDFSDQIALTARLAQECPEVAEAERAAFKVVLLDEYQDTSVAQARMLHALFGAGHPVMAVGDPNQAIYGWRGASVSNIVSFPDQFGGHRLNLVINRRSERRILAVANHLAGPLYADGVVQPLQPDPAAGDGEVHLAVHDTYDEELAAVAEQVLLVHRAGTLWREIAVLARTNRHSADLYDALVEAGIPVEIVGINGLLRLPEVAEVLATLTLIDDVTANASLLTLLTSARWAIGPRDLALLGRRARELAGSAPARDPGDVRDQLIAATDSVDPLELPALSDALEDPGQADYSAEALARFAALAAELRRLRSSAGEPILDLVRRIIDVTGVDVELASAVSESAAARRENLDLFVQAIGEFTSLDGQVTLPAVLAWLEAEDEFGQGLQAATPSQADSVKLLSVHRSKGLEWDVVFLPGITAKEFPVERLRSHHLSSPAVLPVSLRGDAHDLEDVKDLDPKGITEWTDRRRRHSLAEERRLGYVAWTRPRNQVRVSAWRWRRDLVKGRGPSMFAEATREAIAEWGQPPDAWLDAVTDEDVKPFDSESTVAAWPIDHATLEATLRREAARLILQADDPGPVTPLVAEWDRELDRLLAELDQARSTTVEVRMPDAMSATSLAVLAADPDAFLARIARPMPQRPSPAARFGTRFHAWVEQRFGQQDLFDPDELPGRADDGIADDQDLAALIESFESGPFAERVPEALEAPFSLVLGGQIFRGRIDAVYADADGFLVVDWKTGRPGTGDPLQLALYRLAWAELAGVDPGAVRAAFSYVRSGETVMLDDLPGRAELESLFNRASTPNAAERPARLAPMVEADGP